jgi:hypothetical protein
MRARLASGSFGLRIAAVRITDAVFGMPARGGIRERLRGGWSAVAAFIGC